VDDDEVGEMDDSSDDLYDNDDNAEYDANETFSEGSDHSDSDIEEIFPQLSGILKKANADRYREVSEDEIEEIAPPPGGEEEEETRYSVKKPKTKAVPTTVPSDQDSDEEGEISAIFESAAPKSEVVLTKREKRERKAKSAARKAFWDAKGVADDEEESSEDGLAVIE
jgi:hypothetical protein